jgi:hypothetical protein
MLTPSGDGLSEKVAELKTQISKAEVRVASRSPQTRISIMLTDNSELMIWEDLQESNETPNYSTTALIIYSSSKSIASSISSMFDALWAQTELHDQIVKAKELLEGAYRHLAEQEMWQREFVNLEAHEL